MADENTTKTDKHWLFKAGQSGNPKGRPQIPPEVKDAFKRASKEAVLVIFRIMTDPEAKDSDKLKAAEIVFNRTWGTPAPAEQVQEEVRAIVYEAVFEDL